MRAAPYDGSDRRKGPTLEKHIQTLLSGLILVLLAWFGWSMVDMRDRVTKVESKVDFQIEATKKIAESTAGDKASEVRNIEKITELRLEVQLLKDRMTRLESRVGERR